MDGEIVHPGAAVVWDVLAHPYTWPGAYGRWIVLEDGEVLCRHCTAANVDEIVYAVDGDGWAAIGATHSGEVDECARCAHCGDCVWHPVGLGRPEVVEVAVCGDCAVYLANGDGPDTTTPAGREAWQAIQRADIRESGAEWVLAGYGGGECDVHGDGEWFAWAPCDYCRRHLGGTRLAALTWPTATECDPDADGRYVYTVHGVHDRARATWCEVCGHLEVGEVHGEHPAGG